MPLLVPAFLYSQSVLHGLVSNEKEELLIGAHVYWKDTHVGAITDTSGYFDIPARPDTAILSVQYFNYPLFEASVFPGENNLWILIPGSVQLQAVEIEEQQFGNRVSTLETRNLEQIDHKELRKAPCCNLSESFETNGSVDVRYPDAVTGIREIQLLGLRGIYSQFLIENRPTMTGIAIPFGFDFIPGSWLRGIVLAKGASTVKNGNMGITGQINADLVKPDNDKPLFVNVFSSTEGRGELNIHVNRKRNAHFSQGLLMHGSLVRNRWDRNRDNFYDAPNRHQINALYRAIYDGALGCAQFNVQMLDDRRISGQIDSIPGSVSFFGVNQHNQRIESWAKFGLEGIGGKRFREIGNIAGFSWHQTEALFGSTRYWATQRSLYLQSLYQTIINNTQHKIVVAPSFQYDNISEHMQENAYHRIETSTGIMSEYTYRHPSLRVEGSDFVWVAGLRADYNNRFGWQLTPRFSAKYNLTEHAVVRISGGLGYRSPNLIAENLSLLASNRYLNFAPDLRNEAAWNYGLNYTHDFKILHRNASISLDAFRTDFIRQIVVDVDADPTVVSFYNLKGISLANSILLVAQWNVIRGLDLKIGLKWNDVRTTYANGMQRTPPLVARQRGLITLDYTTPRKKWSFNVRTHVVGRQRLPDVEKIPHEYTHGLLTESPVYWIWSGQITRRWEKIEWYAGMENISNYQQHLAVVAAREPWSPYFNGSRIWAPMMGQMLNMGVRYTPQGL